MEAALSGAVPNTDGCVNDGIRHVQVRFPRAATGDNAMDVGLGFAT